MEKMVNCQGNISYQKRHLIAILVYVALLAMIFSPVLFGDKSIYPLTYAGRSTEYLISDPSLLNNIDHGGIYTDAGASDWVEIPLMTAAAHTVRNYELPFWNMYNSLGMPIIDNNNGSTLAPFSLIIYIGNSEMAWNIMYIVRLLFIMVFTYLFLHELGLKYLPSVTGGILFGFSGYVMFYLNIFFMHADAFLPMLMWTTLKYMKNKTYGWWLWCSATITAMCLGGNPQNLITCCILSFTFFLVHTFDRRSFDKAERIKTLKRIFKYLGCYISGILLSLGYWLSFFTLYANSYSYHANAGLQVLKPESLWGIIIPRGRFEQAYRGLWLPYAGILTVGLILLQIRFGKQALYQKTKIFFSIFVVLFLSKIVGFPLLQWVGNLPILNELSFTKYNSCIYFSLVVLAAIAINDMILAANRKRDFLLGVLLTSLTVILNFLYHGKYFENDLRAVSFWELVFIVSLILVICYWLVYILRKNALKHVVVAVTLCAELISYTYYCSDLFIPYGAAFETPPFVNKLKEIQHDEKDRIFCVGNILMGNLSALYNICSINGVSATPEIHYWNFMNELVLNHNINLQMVTTQSTAYYPPCKKILDMLGVKYIVIDDYGEIDAEHLSLVYDSGRLKIYENTAAAPRAYAVHNIIPVNNEEEALAIMKENMLDYSTCAIVEQETSREFMQTEASVSDIVEVVDYKANSVSIQCHMGSEGLLILSDLYYPGWNVYVNGEKKEIVRTNDILRGVYLEQGDSMVKFVYRPMAFYMGMALSACYLVLLIVVGIINYKGKGAHT